MGGVLRGTGLLLLVTGVHTTVTWPFGSDGFEYTNIAFRQPAAAFGALLVLAAVYLSRQRAASRATLSPRTRPRCKHEAGQHLGRRARTSHGGLAITFLRFQLGAAPAVEPISGRFGHLPILEALFLGGL